MKEKSETYDALLALKGKRKDTSSEQNMARRGAVLRRLERVKGIEPSS
ncbi:hypothetical protein IFT74_00625 [Oxalobacteraceae sp. CFBP 8755]|nr:hypothetical protein [Oxalobacteraceae sp. CFBP 8755]